LRVGRCGDLGRVYARIKLLARAPSRAEARNRRVAVLVDWLRTRIVHRAHVATKTFQVLLPAQNLPSPGCPAQDISTSQYLWNLLAPSAAARSRRIEQSNTLSRFHIDASTGTRATADRHWSFIAFDDNRAVTVIVSNLLLQEIEWRAHKGGHDPFELMGEGVTRRLARTPDAPTVMLSLLDLEEA